MKIKKEEIYDDDMDGIPLSKDESEIDGLPLDDEEDDIDGLPMTGLLISLFYHYSFRPI